MKGCTDIMYMIIEYPNYPSISLLTQPIVIFSGYNLGISVVDPKIIREEQRSYETGRLFVNCKTNRATDIH